MCLTSGSAWAAWMSAVIQCIGTVPMVGLVAVSVSVLMTVKCTGPTLKE